MSLPMMLAAGATRRKKVKTNPFDRGTEIAIAKQTQAQTGLDPMSKLFRDLTRNKVAETKAPGLTASERALQTLGFEPAKARMLAGTQTVREKRVTTPGTIEHVMRQIDNDPQYRGIDPETRSLIDSALTVRGYNFDPNAHPFEIASGLNKRPISPIAGKSAEIRLKNDDVLDVLAKVRSEAGRAVLKAQVAGFRERRRQMSQAVNAFRPDFEAGRFTPEALHDAQLRQLTAVRGKDGQAIEMVDALREADGLGWGTGAYKPMSEDDQAMEMAAPRGNLGQEWIKNGVDIREYLDSRFANAAKAGGDWVYKLTSTIAPALEQSMGANIYQMAGGLPAGLVQAIPMTFSNLDYAFDTKNKPYDRVMAGIEGLMNIEFASGVPILGHLIGKGAAKLSGAAEVHALAKDFGVPKEDVVRALQEIRDPRNEGVKEIVGKRLPTESEHVYAGEPAGVKANTGEAKIEAPTMTPLEDFSTSTSLRITGKKDKYGTPGIIDPRELKVNPEIQYKSGTNNKSRTTDKFRDVNTYDVNQGGALVVWRRQNGDIEVVHGHHRAELASRADRVVKVGPDLAMVDVPREVPVRILDEADNYTLGSVRKIGAFENLYNGDGTALDAAMVVKELGIPRSDLGKRGITLKHALGRDVDGMLGLDNDALRYVRHNDVPDSVAAGVGSVDGLEGAAQIKAMNAAVARGKRTYSESRQFGLIYKDSLVDNSTGSLFGDDLVTFDSTVEIQDKLQSIVKNEVMGDRAANARALAVDEIEGEIIRRDLRAGDAERYGSKAGLNWRLDSIFSNYKDIQQLRTDISRRVHNGEITEKAAAKELRQAVDGKLGNSVREIVEARGQNTGRVLGGGNGESGAITGLDSLRTALQSHFKLGDGEADAVAAITKARADTHVREFGGTVDDYVVRRVGEVRTTAPGEKIAGEMVPQGAKGAVEFANDGRATIHALENPDVSTATHELFHVFMQDLPEPDVAILNSEHQRYLQRHGNKPDAHADIREFFARQGERYLADGKTNHEALKGIFERFKAWFKAIYKSVKGTAIEARVSNEMHGMYERLFGAEKSKTIAELDDIDLKGRHGETYKSGGKTYNPSDEQFAALEALQYEFRNRRGGLQALREEAKTPQQKDDFDFEIARLATNYKADEARILAGMEPVEMGEQGPTLFQNSEPTGQLVVVKAEYDVQKKVFNDHRFEQIGDSDFYNVRDTVENRFVLQQVGAGLDTAAIRAKKKMRAIDDGGLFGNEVLDQGALFQRGERREPFYLKSQQIIEDKMRGAMPIADLRKMLENGGVKADEMKWTGLDDFLRERNGKRVTPDEVRDYLTKNRVEVHEVVKMENPVEQGFQATYRRFMAQAEAEGLSESLANDLALEARDTKASDRVTELGYSKTLAERFAELHDGYQERLQNSTRGASPKYKQYTVPGGENYREVLLTLPAQAKPLVVAAREYYEHFLRNGGEPGWPSLSEARQLEIIDAMPEYARNSPETDLVYRSPHWDEPNVMSHVRLSDRIINGKSVLFAEEVQSDWHQAGREKGYRVDKLPKEFEVRKIGSGERDGYEVVKNGIIVARSASEKGAIKSALGYINEGTIASGPFSKTWHEVSMRKVIEMATTQGYDAVAWTTGDTQALRYNQTLQDAVSHVKVSRRMREMAGNGPKAEYEILAVAKDGRQIVDDLVDEARLREMIGGSMAKDAMAAFEAGKSDWAASGDQLKIGGHGMREFYDKILPRFLNKEGKKWGAQVRDAKMPFSNDSAPGSNFGTDVHLFEINDAMRQGVLDEGQVLFQKGEKSAEQKAFERDAILRTRGIENGPDWFRDPFDRTRVADERQNPEWNAVKANIAKPVVAIFGDPKTRLRNLSTAGSEARRAGNELADGLEKIVQFSTSNTLEISRHLEETIRGQYGKSWMANPKAKAELRDLAVKLHEGRTDELTPKQAAIHKVWVETLRYLRPEAESVGVWVDDHVADHFRPKRGADGTVVVDESTGRTKLERVHKYKHLMGEMVGFYKRDANGTAKEMFGQVIGGGDNKVSVKVLKTGRVVDLEEGEMFSRRSLVDDDKFLPRVIKREYREAFQKLFNGGLTAKMEAELKPAIEMVGEQMGIFDDPDLVVAKMKHVWQQSLEPNSVVGSLARIEKPRMPWKLPTEMYEVDVYKLMQNHIAGTVKRITEARIWGQDGLRAQQLLGRISRAMGDAEAKAMASQIRHGLGTHASAEAESALRTMTAIEGAWQTTTKLTGLTTALKQIPQTAAAYGILGGKAWTKGITDLAKDLVTGKAELQAIKDSGAITNDIKQLAGMDHAPKMAEIITDIGMTATGVKTADGMLRYHAAVAGRVAVEDAVKRLVVTQENGVPTVQRNAAYRMLKNWFGYEDQDIIRIMGKGLNKNDRVMAYNGGVKTQLMSRKVDMPKMLDDMPPVKMLLRFQTFNYQQSKLIGYAVKEAAAGNVVPLARTVAGYAVAGYLSAEAIKKVTGWMTGKRTPDEAKREARDVLGVPEHKMTLDEVAGLIMRDTLKSGLFGLYGKSIEDALGRLEGDPDVTLPDVLNTAGNVASSALAPPLLRDIGAVMKSGAYAAKTEGGLPAWFDEFLREAVVPYKRLAMRGDADYAGIKQMRAEAKKVLEEQGLDDSTIENYLNVKWPTPAPRGATEQYKSYRASAAEWATKLGKADRANELAKIPFGGRAPKKYASDPEPKKVRRRRGMNAFAVDKYLSK